MTKKDSYRSARHYRTGAFYAGLLCALIFLTPVYAHAGVFSFFAKTFSGSERVSEAMEASLTGRNSQNVALLEAALNSDPNPSTGGAHITIVDESALMPDVGPLGTLADVERKSPKTGKISVYVVREGDSLSQIADMFGVSVNTIIWANDIKRGDLIRTGQRLIILPVSGVRYTVKENDTLGSIAKKLGGDVEEIIEFNDLGDTSTLAVGTTIVVPNGELGSPSYPRRSAQTRVRGTNAPLYAGYYARPVDGIRTQGLHGYNAVDIGAPRGTPVIASASGNVIIAKSYGWNGGYGKYIVVAHENGTQTLYAHLSSIIVDPGSRVVKGQVIGHVGSTGNSTGPHTHFEIRGAKNPF